MLDRASRLRIKRKLRRRRQAVEGVGDQAEAHIDKHFFGRLNRFVGVRRFVFSWVLLLVLLSGITVAQVRSLSNYYLETVPAAGGTYHEGMVGAFTNANPLYATSLADTTISRLLFSSLLQLNDNNELVGDLASSWEANEAGDVYTVTLKPQLEWQDGAPITAHDVAFTFNMAGHPDAKSHLLPTWRDITVEAKDDSTVVFTLESPLASFPYTLTTGIVPRHKLEAFTPEQLRSSDFNTLRPVGSGPFSWEEIDTVGTGREEIKQQIAMVANETYHKGEPHLEQYVVHTYANTEQLLKGFSDQEVNAIVGLDTVHEELKQQDNVHAHETPLMAANMVFFNTEGSILKDASVRRALLQAVDKQAVREELSYPVIPVDQAVLREHFVYRKKYNQRPFNAEKARQLLDKAGWKLADDGLRYKKDAPLSMTLYAQNTPDFSTVTHVLQRAWADVGVQLNVVMQSPQELQTTVSNRTYDMLLSGITIGPGPDVFVFWHSSQADARSGSQLNFSHYANDAADEALEAARTRLGNQLRFVKLEPFLKQWQKDAPGFGLYQPRFIYVTKGKVYNYGARRMTYPLDRLWNVHEWMVRDEKSIIPE